MANSNAPNGLRPVRHKTGGCIKHAEYPIASAYATNIFYGDIVEILADGTIGLAPEDNVDNLGVFQGVQYVNASGEQVFSKYWPSSTVATEIKALVIDDPMVVFEVQASTYAETDRGSLVDWENSAGGSTTTGMSGLYADMATAAATNASLRVLGPSKRAGNAVGAYCIIEVVFAEHIMLTGAGGAGGITT